MKNQTCCFTGHRDLKDSTMFRKKLKSLITMLIINNDVKFFGVGGALGFDTIASLCLLELKKKFHHIKLILVLPCPEQSKYWSKKDKMIYEKIKRNADKIVYISHNYTKDCMIKRNCWLVDNSGYCIAYCIKNKGGTHFTVNYAKNKGLKIFNLGIE